FARLAMARPELFGLGGPGAYRAIDAALRERSDEPWEELLGAGDEDAQVELLSAWDEIRSVPGHPLENAARTAEKHPLELPADEAGRRSRGHPPPPRGAGWARGCRRGRARLP